MLYLSLAGGLILLLAGGELFVRGAVAVARRLGVSKLFVGLVLVGFGTSSPELVASLRSALVGAPDVATGNVVGSNIANVLLVLGVAALVAPAPDDLLEAYPVSTRVNRTQNDDAACVKPLTKDFSEELFQE